MRVLFDQGTPVPLRRALVDHDVSTAHEMGWSRLLNGELIAAAEAGGFQGLVTTDKSFRHQQNLSGRRLGVLVLPTTDWATIRCHTVRVAEGLAHLQPGTIVDVNFDDS